MVEKSSHKPPRVVWFAGTRGELLQLGPLFKAIGAARHGKVSSTGTHWLMNTAEQGMAVQQALDLFALEADETAELCHPGDESAHRLNAMMTRVESFARGRRADHLVCAGYGPTAAACALTAFARGNRVLWVRLADPAGLIARLGWESCLRQVIESCALAVTRLDVPGVMDWSEFLCAGAPGLRGGFDAELYGLREGAPRVLVAVLRREWGLRHGVTDKLARALGAAAARRGDVDWVISSNLNARLEEPIRALVGRAENLRIVPPLAMGAWRELLGGAKLVITDSPSIAGEAMREGIGLVTLGDEPGQPNESQTPIVPSQLSAEGLIGWLEIVNGLDIPPREALNWSEVIAGVRNYFERQ